MKTGDNYLKRLVVCSEDLIASVPEWARTLYLSETGIIFMPVCSSDLNNQLIPFLKNEKVNFVVSVSGHVYIKTSDVVDIFPDMLQIVESVLSIVENINNGETETVH